MRLCLQFYYNSNLEQCEEFTFGGCEGNGNRFSSVGECEQVGQPCNSNAS